jgi:hypothetical protein
MREIVHLQTGQVCYTVQHARAEADTKPYLVRQPDRYGASLAPVSSHPTHRAQVPSSGKSSRRSTASSGMVSTRALTTSSSSALTSITTRLARTSTCPVRSSSTSNRVPWTLFAPALSAVSSARTTSSSARAVPVTTGPRAVSTFCDPAKRTRHLTGKSQTTRRVLSSLTRFSTSSARRLKVPMLSRVSHTSHLCLYRTIYTHSFFRLPDHPLPWWWYRCRYGYPSHLQDP